MWLLQNKKYIFHFILIFIFSIDLQFGSSWVIGVLFSFSENSWEFPWLCVLGSLSCWNVYSPFISIILVDGSRFLSRISHYISFIHPSCNYMKFATIVLQKYNPIPGFSHLQTSLLVCYFWVEVQCHLSSKHGVYYGIQRVQFWSHLTRLYSRYRSTWTSLVELCSFHFLIMAPTVLKGTFRSLEIFCYQCNQYVLQQLG